MPIAKVLISNQPPKFRVGMEMPSSPEPAITTEGSIAAFMEMILYTALPLKPLDDPPIEMQQLIAKQVVIAVLFFQYVLYLKIFFDNYVIKHICSKLRLWLHAAYMSFLIILIISCLAKCV